MNELLKRLTSWGKPVAPPAHPPPRPHRDFKWSISVDFGMSHPVVDFAPAQLAKMIARLKELQVDEVRIDIPMRDTLDIATNPDNVALRLVKALREAGIGVVPAIGIGSVASLPEGLSVDDPDYIERVAKNVKDIVGTFARTRLSNGQPLGVEMYQLENELNAAALQRGRLQVGLGWREGQAWESKDFKIKLLKALAKAVDEADPAARTYTNLPDGANDRGTTGDEMLRAFAPYVDEIGLDLYPNFFLPRAFTEAVSPPAESVTGTFALLGTSEPGELLSRRVKHFEDVSGKPVRISEFGYSTNPVWLGHTEEDQAHFVEETTRAAYESGATAFNYFRLFDFEPPGGQWDFSPNNLNEPYFGLLDEKLEPKTVTIDGQQTSGYERFKDTIAEIKGK